MSSLDLPAGSEEDPPPFPGHRRLDSERIYDSIWCGLRKDRIELPDGAVQDYHIFEVPPAVSVVPVLPDGSILLLWQYRYPHGETHWEVPAGRMHAGEDPIQAAERELLEETGHRARRLVPLPGFYAINGISPHFAHAFLAEGCECVAEPALEPAEQLVVRRFSRARVLSMLHAGTFRDGFTALSLFYAIGR